MAVFAVAKFPDEAELMYGLEVAATVACTQVEVTHATPPVKLVLVVRMFIVPQNPTIVLPVSTGYMLESGVYPLGYM